MSSSTQSMRFSLRMFYKVKPFIPRPLQLWLRRYLARRMRQSVEQTWPILEQAAKTPVGWRGWPDTRQFAVVLTHDVEHALGVLRCKNIAKLEAQYGFRSSFNFVPERYDVPDDLRSWLTKRDFEVGVHGLNHDGRLFETKEVFESRAEKINRYLSDWNAVGFRSPAMHHNLAWLGQLNVEYDLSTFDTDPFEPQSTGMSTIFPFLVDRGEHEGTYVEMPYTLPQDHTLFVILQENTINIWKKKIDWIAANGGMVLVNVHPDYICLEGTCGSEEYPISHYEELLKYIATRYDGQYWNALPRAVASHYRSTASPQPQLQPVSESTYRGDADSRNCRHRNDPKGIAVTMP